MVGMSALAAAVRWRAPTSRVDTQCKCCWPQRAAQLATAERQDDIEDLSHTDGAAASLPRLPQVPFAGHSPPQIKQAVLAGQRPEESLSCPPQLAALVRACVSQDPSARPSAAALLEQLKALQL